MRPAKPPRLALDLRGLTGDSAILRLSEGRKRDDAVERWLNAEPRELRLVAQAWFERMRQCGDDVRELIHDGCPVVCVEDAPFAYVNAFARHVNVGFFRGAQLEDPAGLLQGSGKHMRRVKLRPGHPPDEAALRALILAAYRDIRARLDLA